MLVQDDLGYYRLERMDSDLVVDDLGFVRFDATAGQKQCTPGKTVPCGNVCRAPQNCKKGKNVAGSATRMGKGANTSNRVAAIGKENLQEFAAAQRAKKGMKPKPSPVAKKATTANRDEEIFNRSFELENRGKSERTRKAASNVMRSMWNRTPGSKTYEEDRARELEKAAEKAKARRERRSKAKRTPKEKEPTPAIAQESPKEVKPTASKPKSSTRTKKEPRTEATPSAKKSIPSSVLDRKRSTAKPSTQSDEDTLKSFGLGKLDRDLEMKKLNSLGDSPSDKAYRDALLDPARKTQGDSTGINSSLDRLRELDRIKNRKELSDGDAYEAGEFFRQGLRGTEKTSAAVAHRAKEVYDRLSDEQKSTFVKALNPDHKGFAEDKALQSKDFADFMRDIQKRK